MSDSPRLCARSYMRRMRCLLCRRPWAATPAAPTSCPFCGCERTVDAEDVLVRAFPVPTAAARRRGWLFAKRSGAPGVIGDVGGGWRNG